MFDSSYNWKHGKEIWVLVPVIKMLALLEILGHFTSIFFRSFLTARVAIQKHVRLVSHGCGQLNLFFQGSGKSQEKAGNGLFAW